MRFARLLALLGLGILLSTQAACHTTQLGQRVGFPSPEERAQEGGLR